MKLKCLRGNFKNSQNFLNIFKFFYKISLKLSYHQVMSFFPFYHLLAGFLGEFCKRNKILVLKFRFRLSFVKIFKIKFMNLKLTT